MAAIGSITRLTGSGLSMVDWHPATGLTAHLMLAVAIYSYIHLGGSWPVSRG
ncbi:MAG TPA: hypothetical protein ENG90_07155 [Gammaproteobacteria bacterium]|nr:hypothetical protein [Gammaproteobacteria bacterium]HDH16240.1 hypothetical protein [Gammaproteobacteria bacterium]HDZ78273.1 hypothetical protein [Gammaproteobacteria bacterium]